MPLTNMDLGQLSARIQPHIIEASEMIARAWNDHQFTETKKDERDIVTTTDVAVEDFLRDRLSKVLPQAGFIVEEGTSERQAEYNFTIDPIDGTKYFAKGVPLFFCQVALLKEDEPILSFVSQPITKQLFWAIKHKGAYLNEVPIPPLPAVDLSRAIVEFDSGSFVGEGNLWKFRFLEKICGSLYRPRFTSGHLSVYLATGAVDAGINIDIKTPFSIKNIVDLAPHKLIVTEIGHKQAFLDFEDKKVLIWAHDSLISQIQDKLAK